MNRNWRPRQIEYNREILRVLAGLGRRFWAWEIVIMFYEVVTALDWYAEMPGMGAPINRAARRAIIEKWFPHPACAYNELYGLSLTARHGRGYAMTKRHQLTAAHCSEILMKDITMR